MRLNFKDVNYNTAVLTSGGVLIKYEWIICIRFVSALFTFISLAGLRWMGFMDFPLFAFMVPNFVEIFVNQPYPFLVRNAKNPDLVIFVNCVIDMFVITWALHAIGGMNAFFFVLVYPLVFISIGIVLGKKHTFYLANIAFVCYASLVYLESHGILPVLGLRDVQMPDKVRMVNTLMVLPFFNLLAFAASFLGGLMHDREKQLRETKNMLYQAGKLAARSGTTMAHKINTPLTKIKNQLGLLEQSLEYNNPHLPLVKSITHQVEDIDEVINGAIIKDINAGAPMAPVDVHKYLEEAFSITGIQLRDNHVRVQRQYGEDVPHVHADAKQIEQLFVNIIGNIAEGAVQQESGDLLVKTQKIGSGVDRPQDTLEVVLINEKPSEAEIRMAQEFKPDAAVKDAGAGMWLLTCIAIVTRHGGKLRIRYDAGRGVQYLVSLPLNPAPVQEKI